MGVQDFFGCINLVAKMTIERFSFGTVFFGGGVALGALAQSW